MLKSIEKIFSYITNTLLPRRNDFDIVKNLDEKTINNLSRALKISGSDWIHPMFNYKDNRVRAIIWELKYKENTLPLEHIGKIIYDEIVAVMGDIMLFDGNAKFLLIPVPISKERRMERGYNQSEFIAKSILENDLGHHLLYAPQWFQKIKDTPKQSHTQNKEERLRNLYQCFFADPKIEGYYVFLIDDVVTTGATLREASIELDRAGAKSIIAFTIAH